MGLNWRMNKPSTNYGLSYVLITNKLQLTITSSLLLHNDYFTTGIFVFVYFCDVF